MNQESQDREKRMIVNANMRPVARLAPKKPSNDQPQDTSGSKATDERSSSSRTGEG